jgi:hypothetical protein
MLSRIWVPQGELEQYSPEQLSKLQLLLARMSVVVADVRMACHCRKRDKMLPFIFVIAARGVAPHGSAVACRAYAHTPQGCPRPSICSLINSLLPSRSALLP